MVIDGEPDRSSISKLLTNAGLGCDYVYLNYEIEPIQRPCAVRRMKIEG